VNAVQRLFSSRWGLLVIYAVFLGAYLAASGPRLRRHSQYNHFVYLAEGWLKGRLDMPVPPPNENDWAKVDVLTLQDGRVVKGMFKAGAQDRFVPLSGPAETITPDEIASRTAIRYVSFPPFPAVPMLPFVAIWHLQFNDVLFTVLWAALNPVLLFLLLRDLRRRGYSQREVTDDLWLTALFGVGSVYFYCAVLGQVWYTAHVIGVTCVLVYAWASLEAARPMLAGLCVGLGFATRTPLGFMFPFFVWEALRTTGAVERWRSSRRLPPDLLGKLIRFALPAACVLALLLWHNHARFERATEFGHKFLNIAWQERIQRWGLFNYHFLSRNLAAALILLPRILASYPFVKVSQHGLSLLVTSPNLAYLAVPARKSPLRWALWLTVISTALPALLYQNSGYIQFGYRFSLDYMVFFVMLLAIEGRPLSWLWKTLVVIAAGINLFGAITFDRYLDFSYDDSFFPHGNH
jgi:hypothetical protein